MCMQGPELPLCRALELFHGGVVHAFRALNFTSLGASLSPSRLLHWWPLMFNLLARYVGGWVGAWESGRKEAGRGA